MRRMVWAALIMSKAYPPTALQSQKNAPLRDSEGEYDTTQGQSAAAGESALVGDKRDVKTQHIRVALRSNVNGLDSTPPTNPYPMIEKNTFFDLPPGEGDLTFPDGNPAGLTYLENIAASCPNRVPYLVGKNAVAKAAVIFKPRCKLWSCPVCARINSDLWCMRATIGTQHFIDAGDTVQLVTITSHERVNRRIAIERLPEQWNKLRNRWQREVGKPAYFLVGETGNKSAHFHLHIITNKSPSERFWKDNARASGMGYIANESDPLVNASRAGFYCGKYLSKQFSAGKYKKGYHRVRCSHSWPKLPRLPRDENWEFDAIKQNDSVADLAHYLRLSGWRVALADYKTAWSVINAC